jgi:hypothetical protein
MFGPSSYVRRVDVQPWSAIEANYTAAGGVRDELARLMSSDFEPGKGGQLLLWQGPPGTGKTWALRALASEWREWAEIPLRRRPRRVLRRARRLHGRGAAPRGVTRTTSRRRRAGREVARARPRGHRRASLERRREGEVGAGALPPPERRRRPHRAGPPRPRPRHDERPDRDVPSRRLPSRPVRERDRIRAARPADEVAALLGDEDPSRRRSPSSSRGRAKPDADPMPTLPDRRPRAPGRARRRLRLPRDRRPGGGADREVPRLRRDAVEPTDDADLPSSAAPRSASRAPQRSATRRHPCSRRYSPRAEPEAEVELPEQRTNASLIRWEGVLVVEDTITEDGRYIMPGATTWRDLPLSLAAMLETEEGHTAPRSAAASTRSGARGTSSWDAASSTRPTSAARSPTWSRTGRSAATASTSPSASSSSRRVPTSTRAATASARPTSIRSTLFDEGDDAKLVVVFRDCVIGMSTVCPFPAFADAQISVSPARARVALDATADQFVLTALGPVSRDAGGGARAEEPSRRSRPHPSRGGPRGPDGVRRRPRAAQAAGEWFADPQFSELTPLTVTDDGRVFGHFAQWDTCHIGIPDVCTTAPSS